MTGINLVYAFSGCMGTLTFVLLVQRCWRSGVSLATIALASGLLFFISGSALLPLPASRAIGGALLCVPVLAAPVLVLGLLQAAGVGQLSGDDVGATVRAWWEALSATVASLRRAGGSTGDLVRALIRTVCGSVVELLHCVLHGVDEPVHWLLLTMECATVAASAAMRLVTDFPPASVPMFVAMALALLR